MIGEMTYQITVQVPRELGGRARLERRAVDAQLVAQSVARLDVVNHGIPHRSVFGVGSNKKRHGKRKKKQASL